MRGAAGRGLLLAQPRPILLATYRMNQVASSVASGATTTITATASNMSSGSASIPVSAGDVLIFKCTSGTANFYASAISWTGAGGTFARWINQQVASWCPITLWSGLLTASGSITPTITFTAAATQTNQSMEVVIERWANAKVDSTCMVAFSTPASATSISTNGTPNNAQSMISSFFADYTATSPTGAITYLNGATQNIAPFMNSGILATYSSTQPALAQSAQVIGLTSGSVAQKDTIGAIEIKPIAA